MPSTASLASLLRWHFPFPHSPFPLPLTPLDSTLMTSLVSVANKELTGSLSSLESTLIKNGGGWGVLLLTRNPRKNFYPACRALNGEGASRPKALSSFPIRESPLASHASLVTIHQSPSSAILKEAIIGPIDTPLYPQTQGATCSRCASIPSSTPTPTSSPTGGSIRRT